MFNPRKYFMIDHELTLFSFLENASLPVHCIDVDGNVIWVNQAELDLLGYEETEYIGLPFGLFYADADIPRNILIKLTNNEKLHNYPAKLKSKDGSIKYVVINSNIIK